MAEVADYVFVNCPFDDAYQDLFEAIVFTIHDCGYVARSALEVDDGSQVRIDKIAALIAACRFGIHDISRTQPDTATGLPRFNMPFELGMFLGAKRYGRGAQKLELFDPGCGAIPIPEVHLRYRRTGYCGSRW
jgi:hypothetical protein